MLCIWDRWISTNNMATDFQATCTLPSRNRLLIELLQKKTNSQDASVQQERIKSHGKLKRKHQLQKDTRFGENDLFTRAQKHLRQQLLHKHRYLQEAFSNQQKQLQLIAKDLEWTIKHNINGKVMSPESAKESTAVTPNAGAYQQRVQPTCTELQSLPASMVPTPKEQTAGLQNISTDVQHSTSTCHYPLKAPHAFQQLTDMGTILSRNNAVLSDPSQKGFRNEEQQQRQQQQDFQLTQPIPMSYVPRRTSTKDLGNIAASSPMHLALPTLSFEPSMAATTTSATRDLHLTSHSLRLQLLHQRYKLQCQQQQQQQQTNSFTNFSTTSLTQPLLDDQIPVAASDMPCNVTDQNPDLWDFDFMDHILSEDDIQALECYIEHDPAFDGEHNCPPSNISNGQEQL